jgi:diguanylate cyclase (GGDEF)-like protein
MRRGLNDAPSVWAIILFSLLCLRQIFVITTNRKLLIVQQKIERSLQQKNLELEQLNQKVQHDATIDFLTNLYNRRHIEKIVDSLTPKGRDAQDVGLLIIDLDYFKRINDTFGHQAGDEVLQKVAYTIRDVLREGDIAGRYGGDEFIAILPNADHEQMKAISERLTEAVESNTQLAMYGVTLSIGASSWHVAGSGYSFHKQFKLTDDALYEAKRNGRHQTRLIQIT